MLVEKHLLSDKDLAEMFGMSASWVRQQRFKRRNGDEHSLTIDPVMVGRCPRYRANDVKKWMDSLG
ncbi:MAG: DNA-binding protein [Proteobacteria bacterium]|nr:DNA-binding protein [Pseudomonadota bacterium]